MCPPNTDVTVSATYNCHYDWSGRVAFSAAPDRRSSHPSFATPRAKSIAPLGTAARDPGGRFSTRIATGGAFLAVYRATATAAESNADPSSSGTCCRSTSRIGSNRCLSRAMRRAPPPISWASFYWTTLCAGLYTITRFPGWRREKMGYKFWNRRIFRIMLNLRQSKFKP
jgi:hypothetical protein